MRSIIILALAVAALAKPDNLDKRTPTMSCPKPYATTCLPRYAAQACKCKGPNYIGTCAHVAGGGNACFTTTPKATTTTTTSPTPTTPTMSEFPTSD